MSAQIPASLGSVALDAVTFFYFCSVQQLELDSERYPIDHVWPTWSRTLQHRGQEPHSPAYVTFHLVINYRHRSHHEPKTAIPVSTVVGGTNQCGICERFSPARCRRSICISTGSRFSRDSQTATAACSSRVSVRI